MGLVCIEPSRLHKGYCVVCLKAAGMVFILRSLRKSDCVQGLARNHLVRLLSKEMIWATV